MFPVSAVVFLTSVPVPNYLFPGLGRGVWARLFMLCVLPCLRLVVAPFTLSGSTLYFSRWSALVTGACSRWLVALALGQSQAGFLSVSSAEIALVLRTLCEQRVLASAR